MTSPQLLPAFEALAAALRPAERMPLSTWCDRHARLSPEASSRVGNWSTFAFQREPLDVMGSTHPCSTVVLCWASQMGKTQLILNFVANVIAEDPGPMLLIEPTLQMAEAISKDRLSPMFRDTPILRGLGADPKARDSGSTVYHRQFQRGHLTLIGANSPAGLASRPIRYVLADEPDRWPPSAGAEGDQLVLAAARQESFWNAKTIIASTPTVKGASRIETAFLESDQRYFQLPCPHCGHFQRLIWPRLEWPEGRPDQARYRCESCERFIDHHEKQAMMARGWWAASNPASPIAGFHISRLYSPWRNWADLAERWGRAQSNPESLRAFINTSLAECWDDAGRSDVTEADLLARRENYGPLIPERAAVLTAGVDVQADRVEVSLYAWGAGEESWLMVHRVIPGDPTGSQLWKDLDDFLSAYWQHPTVGPMPIHAVCIDSGNWAGVVCRYADERRGRRVWAIKAAAGQRPVWPRKQSKAPKGRVYVLGIDSLRTTVQARLRIASGPGGMHFPSTVSIDFFEQLNSEFVRTEYRRGRPLRTWERRPGRRAEVWDCASYALGAIFGLASHGISVDIEAAKIEALSQAGAAAPVIYEVSRSSFMGQR